MVVSSEPLGSFHSAMLVRRWGESTLSPMSAIQVVPSLAWATSSGSRERELYGTARVTLHLLFRKKILRWLSCSVPSLMTTYPLLVATIPESSVSRSSVIVQTALPGTALAAIGVADAPGACAADAPGACAQAGAAIPHAAAAKPPTTVT